MRDPSGIEIIEINNEKSLKREIKLLVNRYCSRGLTFIIREQSPNFFSIWVGEPNVSMKHYERVAFFSFPLPFCICQIINEINTAIDDNKFSKDLKLINVEKKIRFKDKIIYQAE